MTEITVTVTTRSPLNIGSGAQQGTRAQRGMIKGADGWPYIPATTLKGRLRHAVEQIAHTLDHTDGQTVCTTHQDMCRTRPCIVCQMFGAPWVAGKLHFADLIISGPQAVLDIKNGDRRLRTTHRTGVTLNRQRRVGQDKMLYSTELVLPGIPLQFSGVIRGRLTAAQAGLIVAGLRFIRTIGQGKSGGLGWLDTETAVKNGDEIWDDEMLLAAVTALKQRQEENV